MMMMMAQCKVRTAPVPVTISPPTRHGSARPRPNYKSPPEFTFALLPHHPNNRRWLPHTSRLPRTCPMRFYFQRQCKSFGRGIAGAHQSGPSLGTYFHCPHHDARFMPTNKCIGRRNPHASSRRWYGPKVPDRPACHAQHQRQCKSIGCIIWRGV